MDKLKDGTYIKRCLRCGEWTCFKSKHRKYCDFCQVPYSEAFPEIKIIRCKSCNVRTAVKDKRQLYCNPCRSTPEFKAGLTRKIWKQGKVARNSYQHLSTGKVI